MCGAYPEASHRDFLCVKVGSPPLAATFRDFLQMHERLGIAQGHSGCVTKPPAAGGGGGGG